MEIESQGGGSRPRPCEVRQEPRHVGARASRSPTDRDMHVLEGEYSVIVVKFDYITCIHTEKQ